MLRYAKHARVMGLAGLLCAACAPASSARMVAAARLDNRSPGTESRSRVVAGSEVAQFEGTLYEALQRVRPYLLRAGSPTYRDPRGSLLVVFLDDILLGDVSVLHTLSPAGIREVRRIDRSELTIRYGRGDLTSALVIRTR